MATVFSKFDQFTEDLGNGEHDLDADTLKIYLSNTAPTVTDTIKGTSSATEISAGNGYTAGGEDVTATYSQTSGTGTLGATDVTWTASGGTIGPFRYVVLYNDTTTSPADALIGWWDFGSAVTLADGESFGVLFDANTIMTVL